MKANRAGPPRLCHVDPRRLDPREGIPNWHWPAARAAKLGFSHLLWGPMWAGAAGNPLLVDDPATLDSALNWSPHLTLDDAVAAVADACAQHRLSLWMDVDLSHAGAEGALARQHPEWYQAPGSGLAALDPRLSAHDRAACRVDSAATQTSDHFVQFWASRLHAWLRNGVSGFRVHHPHLISPDCWRQLIDIVRQGHPDACFTAWTPGVPADALPDLAHAGFTAAYASLPWWNFRDAWFVAEHRRLQSVGSVIMPVLDPDADASHPHADTDLLQRLWCAAQLGDGLLMRMPSSAQLGAPHFYNALLAANAAATRRSTAAARLRQLTGDAAAFCALENDQGQRTGLLLLNPSPLTPATLDWQLVHDRLGGPTVDLASVQVHYTTGLAAGRSPAIDDDSVSHERGADAHLDTAVSSAPPAAPVLPDHLPPGAVLTATLARLEPIVTLKRKRSRSAQNMALTAAMRLPRIAIQDIAPATPDPTHVIKRTPGEPLTVRANVFMDGHDVLRVFLLWRAVDEIGWHQVEMQALGNDAWEATCVPQRMGPHEYTVRAWRDVFGTFRSEFAKKVEAGLDISLELQEGRELLMRCGVDDVQHVDAKTLLAASTLQAARRSEPHEFETQIDPPQRLMVERRAARFASWYEMFPRSQSGDSSRHGTFDDVIARLPYVRDMGFNVLYFPPIHPIGVSNRKGRNNSLTAQPGDPGSPYAIGAEEGGHDALHPELGTLDDFKRLLHAARQHQLDVALDFAIQCSPDHPWLRDHPDWFAWRADGSLRYAENPPKKYEDIVNVEFYGATDANLPAHKSSHSMDLWYALRNVVLFWSDLGVRMFRVDNPHTKPLPFWQWLIREVQGRYPDAIFLSEAFTRPNMMYRLAKIGFSQSYTYFTWRNTKAELTAYLEEVGNAPVADFFRPHFFVNTPDINPRFLQASGRPGFLIRAALATTMSGLWGMYNGFELCEATPVPGKEEYLDSEKYEIRAWEWHRPGNIRAEITQLNRIRQDNPALQHHKGIRFHHAANEHILFYSKATPEHDNVLLIAINLDPFHAHSAQIELPLWMLGLPDDGVLYSEDLLHGHRFSWHGKYQTLYLSPDAPYAIWRVRANP